MYPPSRKGGGYMYPLYPPVPPPMIAVAISLFIFVAHSDLAIGGMSVCHTLVLTPNQGS